MSFSLNILPKPPECSGCSLEHIGGGFSIPEGKGLLKVAVSAEALGEKEMAEGLPLRPSGASGSVFERAIKRLGFTEINSQFTIKSNADLQEMNW